MLGGQEGKNFQGFEDRRWNILIEHIDRIQKKHKHSLELYCKVKMSGQCF